MDCILGDRFRSNIVVKEKRIFFDSLRPFLSNQFLSESQELLNIIYNTKAADQGPFMNAMVIILRRKRRWLIFGNHHYSREEYQIRSRLAMHEHPTFRWRLPARTAHCAKEIVQAETFWFQLILRI